MAGDKFDVVVVGSCFVDMISYVPHFPKFYETVKGTKFQLDFGGKAAAKLQNTRPTHLHLIE